MKNINAEIIESLSSNSPVSSRWNQTIPQAVTKASEASGTASGTGRTVTLAKRILSALYWVIGFLLSPLSPWNDAILNIPLAIAFAWVVAQFYPPGFRVAVVVGYALTNLIGFILMHIGGRTWSSKKSPSSILGWKTVGPALLYIAVVATLVMLGGLKPVEDALTKSSPAAAVAAP